MARFSLGRVLALSNKEWTQIRRDPVAISFFIILPIIQIVILGLAIDFYPKHMPTAILQYDQSLYTQRFISQLSNSRYFDIKYYVTNESLAKQMIKTNKVVFVITIPENFTRKMIRGEHPSILVENDATIPGASANAINVIQNLADNLFEREFRGPLNYLNANPAPFNINIHNKYNQNLTTTYNTIPGISGAIITFMIIVASLSIASEKETGTLESLLKTPVSSLEIIVGKFLCFFMILFVQLTGITLLANYILFNIPIYGGLITFLLASVPFLASTVMFGIAISASVKNQMQSQQISGFYIIFSLLLTGFIFPFEAMPSWAKVFGSLLPMTHYIRIASGVMLKNYSWVDIWPEEVPILLFLFVTLLIAVIIFRKTLD